MQGLARFSLTLVRKNALKGKGKFCLHAKLLATVSGLPQTDKKHAGTIASNPIKPTAGNSTTTISTPTVTAVSSFLILTQGENGAIGKKIIREKVFVLVGLFEEVNGHFATANADVKDMIESFGGKVNGRFSKNTSKFTLIFCQD